MPTLTESVVQSCAVLNELLISSCESKAVDRICLACERNCNENHHFFGMEMPLLLREMSSGFLCMLLVGVSLFQKRPVFRLFFFLFPLF